MRLVRFVIAAFVAAAVLSAPVVSRTRMFCLATGEEIPPSLCPDEATAASAELLSERCCEHRVQAPLATAKSESSVHWDGVFSPIEIQLAWFVPAPYSPPDSPEIRPPSRTPLSATDILLI